MLSTDFGHPRDVQALHAQCHQFGIAKLLAPRREVTNDAVRAVRRRRENGGLHPHDCRRRPDHCRRIAGFPRIGEQDRQSLSSPRRQATTGAINAPTARADRGARSGWMDIFFRFGTQARGSKRRQVSGYILARESPPRARCPLNPESTVRYRSKGRYATITLDRHRRRERAEQPMIDELDAAFDPGRPPTTTSGSSSSGPRAAFLRGPRPQGAARGEERWAATRSTPEGKLAPRAGHVTSTSSSRSATCARSRSQPSREPARPRSDAREHVRPHLAADDAKFSNPVLRMSGVGVELLVERGSSGPARPRSSSLRQ